MCIFAVLYAHYIINKMEGVFIYAKNEHYVQ